MATPVKISARVERVLHHGHRVYSVSLVAERGFPRFRAGQFLHLTVDAFDPTSGFWPPSRIFSIASRAGHERLRIVYSVKGSYTEKMEAYLAPGRRVWLKLPYGHFIVEPSLAATHDLVLIAGGTGIAPFVPYLEELVDGAMLGRSVLLIYGARTPSLLLFPELLDRCARLAPALTVRLYAEQLAPAEAPLPFATAALEQGALQLDRVLEACRGLQRPVFFVSGPPAMVDSFKRGLIACGVEPARVKIDEW
jgi:ferredoxin-NADP reductase